MRHVYNKSKNRSNIASSILLNGDVLEQVKEAAQNDYFGSANEELSKYLDSIDGKIAKFQNRLQELAATTINSEWIKDIIDLGTGAISVITNLTKEFNGLNVVLGAIGGIIMQIKGIGFLDFDRKQGVQFNQGLANFFKKSDEVEISSSIKNIFGKINEAKQQAFDLKESVNWDDFIKNTNIADDSVKRFLQDTTYSEKTLENYKLFMQGATQATSGFGRALDGLKSIGTNIFSTILQTAAISAALFLFSKLIDGVVYLATRQQKLIDKGKEAQQVIKDTYNTVKQGQQSIKDLTATIGFEMSDGASTKDELEKIAEEYDRLRTGVNQVTNENMSLSTEDYEHYLKICNQLAEQYPSLIKQHDKENNAMLNLGTTSEECANNLKKVYDNALLVANVDIGKNLNDAFVGLNEQIKKYDSENKVYTELSDDLSSQIDSYNDIINKPLNLNDAKNTITFNSLNPEIIEQFKQVAEEFGYAIEDLDIYENATEGITNVGLTRGREFSDAFIESFSENLNVSLQKEIDALSVEKSEYDVLKQSNDMYKQDQQKIIEEIAEDYIQTRPSFNDMNAGVQSAILSNFKLDFEKIENDYDNDWKLYLYSEIITPLSQVNEDAQEEIAKIFELDSSGFSLDSYTEKINNILENAAQKGGVSVDFLKGILPIEDLTKEYEEQEAYLKSVFTGEEDQELINNLSMPELLQAADLVKQRGTTWAKTFQTVLNTITKQKNQLKNDTTFASLLGDTESENGVQKITDNFQALNTEIQGYIDQINNGETVNITDIIQAHPEELAAYGENLETLLEGLLKLQADKSDEFGSQLRKAVTDGLGRNPDPEEVQQAENYIMNLLSSMSINDTTIDELSKKISNSIFKSIMKNTGYAPGLSEYAQETADQLSSQIAEYIENSGDEKEITQEAAFRLSWDTDSATWTFEQWKEKIEAMKIILTPSWEEKQLAKLETEIAGLNNSKTDITNRITDAQNRGLSGNAQDYKDLIDINNQIYEANQRTIDIHKEDIKKIGDITNATDEEKQKYNELTQSIVSLTNEQRTLNNETLQYAEMLNGGIELEGLGRQLTELKRVQSELEIYRNQKTADNEYYSRNDLIDLRNNAEQQISIIEQQNEYLKRQQLIVGDNATEYNKINDQLIENIKTIQELSATVKGYDKSIEHHYSLQAQGLLEGINNVITQSLTDSVSEDSMEALIQSFSELKEISSDIDLTSMFYRSAQGIKVNYKELERYINLQRKLSSTGLLSQISKLNAQLRSQQNIYKTLSKQVDIDGTTKRNAAKQNLQNLRSEIKAIGLEVQAYAEAQRAMEASMSGFSKWQAALQTPREGENYNTIFEWLPELEKLRDAGLVGTDEFKAFVEMMTQEDRTSVAAFEEMYNSWMPRYFTKDHTGMQNFLDDLVSLGIANNYGGMYDITNTDLTYISDQLGTLFGDSIAPDEEIIKEFFNVLKDYGFHVNVVTDALDAQAQEYEKIQELIQAITKESAGIAGGDISTETLAERSEDVSILMKELETLRARAEDLQMEPILTEKEYNEQVAGIQSLLETIQYNTYKDDPAVVSYFYDAAKKMADRLGMEIVEDADGTFSLVQSSYQDTLERMEEATAQKMQDLRNRPKLSLGDLVNAGYDVGEITQDNIDNLVTLYSHTFSNENGTAAVTLTPILPNGEVLSPEALEQYANDILAGARDTKGLVLGKYSSDEGWSDPIEKASQLGDALHRVSDMYENMDEDSERVLNSLRGYSSEFLKTIDMGQDLSLFPDVSQNIKDAQEAIFNVASSLGYSKEEAMQFGTAIIDSFSKFGLLADNFDAEYVVKTRIEDVSKQDKKIEFWQDLIAKGDDETLAKEFSIDLNTYDAEQKLEELKTYISGEDSANYAMTIKIDQTQIDQVVGALNNLNIKVGVDKEAFVNSTQEAIDNAANKLSLSQLEEKLRNSGWSQETIDRRIEQARNDNTSFGSRIVDDITPADSKSVEVIFKVNKEVSDQNIQEHFESLQKYADEHGVTAQVTIENDKVTYTLTAKKDQSFDEVVGEAKKNAEEISGEHKVIVTGDGSGLVSLNKDIDDTKKNAGEGATMEVTVPEEDLKKIEEEGAAINNIQDAAKNPVVLAASITGDDPHDLLNALTTIDDKYKDLIIQLNGEDVSATEAIEKVTAYNNTPITFMVGADEEDKAQLEAYIEEIEAKYPKIQVGALCGSMLESVHRTEEDIANEKTDTQIGGDTDPMKADVKEGQDWVNAQPAAQQKITGETSLIDEALNKKQNDMNSNPLVQPIQMYETPIGPVQQASPTLPPAPTQGYQITYGYAHGTLGGYAQGSNIKNGKLTKDETAVVNELGTEGLIRNGKLTEIPGGMHVEHLKRGDIILNAKQMEELKKSGSASGTGKVVGSPSFATGTIHNGIDSFANASMFGGFDVTPGMHHFFQDLANGVDELDDYKDSAKDAADDIDDALNDIADDLNDLDEHIQPSFQTIDLVQRRLQYFSNATKRIADQITEYVDTATKRQLLGREMSAISQELYANSRAATTYTDEAIKEAFDHKYYATDKNAERYMKEQIIMQKQYMVGVDQNSQGYKDMNNNLQQLERELSNIQNTPVEYHVNLAAEIPLELLRNGEYSLMNIDTSTDHGKALYDAAQQYMQLTDNAINAANQIQTLSNQLRSLYSDMINLPFEDLEKAIGKLENTMQSINSFMTTMSSGGSGINLLKETLSSLFGSKKMKEMIKSYGKTYESLNYQIEMSLQNLGDRVNENNAAYQQSKLTYNDLRKQSKSANSRLNSSKNSLNRLLIPSYAKEQIENGEFLDASQFGTFADKIAKYNQRLAEAKALTSAVTEAQEKMEEQFQKASQSASEYAQAMVQAVFDKMDNVDKYYKSLSDWEATLANSLQTTRDYIIKTGSYLKDGTQIAQSYSQEMNRYKQQADQLRVEGVRLREELQTAMNQGIISYGTEEYRQAMTRIIEVENEYVEARSKVQDLNEEFANIPVKEAEEKLDKIAKKYQSLAQIGNNVSTRGQQRIYTQLADQAAASNYNISRKTYGKATSENLRQSWLDARRNWNTFDTSETYVGANAYLEKDLERMKEETKVSNETMVKLNAEMQRAQKDYDTYEKTVDNYASKYMGAITTIQNDDRLRQMGINAVNNRTKIDTSTLPGDTNSWVMSYINQWNAYIENLETKAGELKTASALLDQETENNQQKIGELASAMAQLYPQEFANAGEYYRSLYENNEKLADTYQQVRETLDELGRSMDQNGNLITDTATLSKNYQNQIDNINKSYNNMKESMKTQSQLLANIKASLGENSEEYRTAQNELYELQNRMNSAIITMDKLRDESREVLYFKPIEEYISKLNKLRDNLDELVGMFSEDMYFTDDGEYTQFGLAAAESAMSGYTRSLQALNKYQEEYSINEERYMHDSSYSAEEYLEKREQITDSARKELQDANSYRTKIISIYTSRYRQEIDYLKELIDARKEALSKEKEMYDYDKQLRTKTKDIQLIQQQIRALENLTDAESKAQKARLEAQLSESQDDLNETVKQHVYDMRIEGLSNLSSDLDKNFEDILKDLKINTSTVVGTINDLSTGLETYIGATNAGIDTWLKTFTPTLHSELVGVEQLTAANTTAIPDKNKLEEAANRMIYYYDNLSAQEAEKLGTITGAVQQETQKVADAIQTYTANKAIMENGANAMTAIKDGFSAITTGIPQQTATAIATNIDRVIEAIKAEDVKINQATPSHMASTSYINPYSTSNSIVNSAISANSGSGKYDYMFDSGGKKSSSSSQNIISSSNIITSSSSNKNPNSTRATNALEKVIEIAVKWQSQIGFNKKQQALDAILNGQYINAGGASSAIQSYVNTWNEYRSLYGQAKIRSAINKALNGSLKSQKSKYGLHTYAKGTLSALPGLAQIFEEGPEIITTKKGTFMPFSGGEGVVPADITKGLMELGIAMQDGKMDTNINRVISTVDNGLGSIKDSVDSLVKPINKIPEEIKASRDVIKESIQFNKLADAQTREVDKKEVKEYSGYIRTAYGSLKPIESNVEMFSSGDELNNMLQDNINALKSYYDELSASATNMINNSGSNNITISSLITVNGNADSETVDQIKQVAIDLTKNKRFLNNIVSYVSQEQAKDLRKSGRSM